MTKLLTLSAALLLTVGVCQTSAAQGRGHDNPGKGKDGHAEHGQGRPDHLGKDERKERVHEARDQGDHSAWSDQHTSRDDRHDRDVVTIAQSGRGPRHGRDHDADRGGDPDAVVRHQIVIAPYRDYGVIRGCPPGLARKGNGCLPPGQAKKIERVRHELAWRAPVEGVTYRYDDGYQYRYDRQGSLLGYLPALGGVLGVGELWPAQYRYDPAPAYQRDYFGLNQPYDYRYADGALYAVDPKTSAIQQVVALLTGQSARVGQRMPPGYDIYNVPYAYRSQYPDSAAAAYRYNDGAIYQLDPKTQVIQAVIQLLT